jgi:uncharacterized membrane protein YraQ (UPF0718 family)
MSLNLFSSKKQSGEACEVHGHHDHHGATGNRMLIAMILISFILIVWHVWTHGVNGSTVLPGESAKSFPVLLGNELWDLLSNKKGILSELREVIPYFLVGIVIAGYIRTYKVAVKLQASLRKYGLMSVFLASFIGIITPLCACGTLTTAISLLFAGIPLAPVMSLMVTSSLLSPSTYLITLNDLGPEWTVIRTVSAYGMGIFAGLVTYFVSKREGFGKNDIFIESAIIRGDFHDDDYPDERLRCNCRRNFGNRVAINTSNKFLVFLAKSSEMLWPVGKYIIVGVVIGEVVERYLPSEWIYRFFGKKDAFSILWITLASIPMFLHQISASSVLSHIKSSLNGTLDSGAALAFMIGGPVTAVPTMVMFWTFFKKRVFALYMFVCVSGTLLITYSFQLLLFTPGVDLGNPLLKGVGALTGGRAAVIRKYDPNVRMVMDPAGKGVIATYKNDIDSRGAIVFDASPDRFRPSALERYNNLTYLDNIADWLDQSASSPSHRKILVYSLAREASSSEAVAAELHKRGYEVTAANRTDIPRLSTQNIKDYDQVWLFCSAGEASMLNDQELKLVAEHNASGKGLLIVAADPREGENTQPEANRLAALFGVTFSGSITDVEKLHVSVASNLMNRASELLGQALKVVKKA